MRVREFIRKSDIAHQLPPEILLKDGGICARHLSRNQVLMHYGETDKERLAMKFQDYQELAADPKKAKALQTWINNAAAEDSAIGQVFNNKDSTRYMATLTSFGDHFMHEEVFSVRWIRDNIHTVTGGVSRYLLSKSSNCDKLYRLWSSSLNAWATY